MEQLSVANGYLPTNAYVIKKTPPAAGCFRTRVISSMQQTAAVNDGETFVIAPDASMKGTVMDTTNAYFQADVEIENNCYSVDYLNTPAIGMLGACFKRITLSCMGAQLEDQQNYSIMASHVAAISGAFDVKTDLYFSSKLVHGYAEEAHLNYVKPPMCNAQGVIMYGFNQFGFGFDTSQMSKPIYANSYAGSGSGGYSNPVGINVQAMTPNVPHYQQTSSDVTLASFRGCFAFMNNLADPTVYGPVWTPNASYGGSILTAMGITPMAWPDLLDPSQIELASFYKFEYGSINKPMITENLANIRCFPIGMKPAFSCTGTGLYTGSVSDPGSQNNTQYVGSSDTGVQINGAVTGLTRYRCIYRPLSGMIGEGADGKWLMTMFFTPTQFRITVETNPAAVAFQYTFDPCRRLVGTIRNYVRNLGTANGMIYGDNHYGNITANSTNYNTFSSFSAYAPGYFPGFSVPLSYGTGLANSSLLTTFSSGAINGRALIQGGYDENVYRVAGYPADVTFPGNVLWTFTVTALSGDTDAGQLYNTSTSLGMLVVNVSRVTGATTLTGYAPPTFLPATPSSGTLVLISSGTGAATIAYSTYTNNADTIEDVAFTGIGGGNPNFTPSPPQYMLALYAHLYNGITNFSNGVSKNRIYYARDDQALFGTYLKASVPQVKRMFNMDFNGANGGNGTNNASTASQSLREKIRYRLYNVCWVSDNLSFNDPEADAILRTFQVGPGDASDKNIVETLTWRSFPIALQNAESQSIPCAIQVNECRRLSFLFFNNKQLSRNTAHAYNSHQGFNPFAAIYAQPGSVVANIAGYGFNTSSVTEAIIKDGTTAVRPSAATVYGNGYNLPLIYKPTPANPSASQRFSAQFVVGQTLFPQNPLNSGSALVAEFCKFKEEMSNKFYSPNIYSLPYQAMDALDATRSGLVFDCLQDDTFFTAFVDENLLDDQTILCNYNTVPLLAYSGSADGTAPATFNTDNTGGTISNNGPYPSTAITNANSSTGYNWISPRGFCIPKLFVPPSSNFALCFSFCMIYMDTGLNSWSLLGNQTMNLNLEGAVGLAVPGESYQAFAVALCNAKYTYGSSGTMGWNA